MSPTFNNYKEVEAYILLKAQSAMANTVALGVKALESKNVKEVVYSSYSPSIYDRDMDDGGLPDIDNMHHEIKNNGSAISLTVENNTKSNSDYNPYGKPTFEIAGLVEYGDKSGYGTYDYPFKNRDSSRYKYLQPRQFIEKTRQDLLNGKARELLVKGLMAEGIRTL